MEYSHRIDLVESWISLRELEIQSSDIGDGNVISYIESLIRKHDTLENTLQVFQHDGIDPLTHDKIILNNHGRFHVAKVHLKLEDIDKRWNFLRKNTEDRKSRLLRSLELSIKIDNLFLSFAKKASAFYSWFESAEEDLMETVVCSSIEETNQLRNHDIHFIGTLSWAQAELKQLLALDRQIQSFTTLPNPYTWYTHDSLQESWNSLQSIIQKRQSALDKECMRQERNDKLKRSFADKANLFHLWLFNTRRSMVENTGQLHEQLELLQLKFENISEKQNELSVLERLSCELQDEMILDNPYTQHTSVGLSQQWDQLSQLGRRMIYNLQQQILSKNMTGVSEEDMKDFQTLFNVYDEDRSGKLEEKEFKSCLISLGYSLQFLEKEQKDSEYENILDQVDPKRLGNITLEDFMSFHISRRTEKVKSREELEDAFRAITTDEKSTFITKDELNRALGTELQEFCLQYMNKHTSSSSACLDYITFTRSLFMS
ncbi:Spectrin alpha chain, brain [Oopsacas minuta]|uniref:Spectrin alpha chain, brain n=1 Tax=Oopsacas minuta TaxID=111878 RepID=A0AAV7KKN6_9METZ|nr:Spectrin alpha chain, brain [Oopsacas minuta]